MIRYKSHIRLNGPHQMLVDCARCQMVSSSAFANLEVCKNLPHLDLSYTNFTNLMYLRIICPICAVFLSLDYKKPKRKIDTFDNHDSDSGSVKLMIFQRSEQQNGNPQRNSLNFEV